MSTFEQTMKTFYSAKKDKPEIITLPAWNFLTIDGIGDPAACAGFPESVEALYGISYTLKFTLKKKGKSYYHVAPLEGLWWADDMMDFMNERRDRWRWILRSTTLKAGETQDNYPTAI